MSDQGTALVTGAARGIGAAVVARLVGRGFHVYAVDACAGATAGTAYPLAAQEDLERVAAAHPDAVTPVVADACVVAQLGDVVDRIRSERGGLQVAVANAAIIAGGSLQWETDDALLEHLWRADAVSVWNTAKVTLPLLLQQDPAQRPTFVAVASAAGEQGLYQLSAYCMAKHAVIGLVRALAADVAGLSVTVAGVSPWSTDTAMLAATAQIYGLDDIGPLLGGQASRAFEPDEVASVIEFACLAGPVVHGSILPAGRGGRE